jgi:Ca2+/H+ antiporter
MYEYIIDYTQMSLASQVVFIQIYIFFLLFWMNKSFIVQTQQYNSPEALKHGSNQEPNTNHKSFLKQRKQQTKQRASKHSSKHQRD